MLSRRLLLPALFAALAVAAATPSVARAEPCWHRVIMDWTKDGVISKDYSPRCLRQAIKKTPEDLRDYSSIIDDINAALLNALAGPMNGANNGGGNGNGGGTMGPSSGPGAGGGVEPPGNASPRIGQNAKKAVQDAGTPASAPGHDRSVPLPLILLACVIAVSALAAGSPPLVKRLRARFPRLKAPPGSVRRPV
jgi:hypothetical protein